MNMELGKLKMTTEGVPLCTTELKAGLVQETYYTTKKNAGEEETSIERVDRKDYAYNYGHINITKCKDLVNTLLTFVHQLRNTLRVLISIQILLETLRQLIQRNLNYSMEKYFSFAQASVLQVYTLHDMHRLHLLSPACDQFLAKYPIS